MMTPKLRGSFGSQRENGDALAQYFLGDMYAYGVGVPEDNAEAVRWYRLAANQNLGLAQSDLGMMYFIGKGVPMNYVLARMWINIAMANGHRGEELIWDILRSEMSEEEIVRATERARLCMTSLPPLSIDADVNYRVCGP